MFVGCSIPFHVPSVVSGTTSGYGIVGRQRTGSISLGLGLGTENPGLAPVTSPSRRRRLSLNVTNNDAAGAKRSVFY